MDQPSEMTSLERLLLALPVVGGIFFGLGPLLLPGPFGSLLGGQGNDPYIYELAGAATFGYAVALAPALQQSRWAPVRLLVCAVLVFNLASLYACATTIIGGAAPPVVYLILVTSLAFVGLTATLLYRHRAARRGAPQIASWLVALLVIATLAATVFGLLPLFVPVAFGHFFGFQATDTFLYQQAGAATLGYAVMGIFELRSRNWLEIRWPLVMAVVFNGLSFLVSLLAIATGVPSWMPYLVAVAALLVTVGFLLALRRDGALALAGPAATG